MYLSSVTAAVTHTIWPEKPKGLTNWPFAENVCQPWYRWLGEMEKLTIRMQKKRLAGNPWRVVLSTWRGGAAHRVKSVYFLHYSLLG